MHRLAILLGGFAVLVAAVATWLSGQQHTAPVTVTFPPQPYTAQTVEPARQVVDFTLTDQDGAPFRLSDSNGSVRLLYFGYTSCPDICPTTLANWRTVKRQLGDAASGVRFIMVTVDPDVDRPARMKRYVQLFDPSFIGLCGSADELTRAWDAFDVHPQRLELPASATQHSISHSTSVYVVDKDGMLRLEIPFSEKADEAVQDILRLMGRAS